MDYTFDILQIYRRYCDIMTRVYAPEREVYGPDDESQKLRCSREELAQLLQLVESKIGTRLPVIEEVYKLMLRLELNADFSEFSRFYNFVFYICRENGQKNITVSRAVLAWRLILAGRFRLLNQWCNYVEENQRHNISEDTWRQVLAFSRCVHENLEGYDPEGAWPVLIDDFVEHMYRTRGSQGASNLHCKCAGSESQLYDDNLNGLKILPGSKRKLWDSLSLEHESLPNKYSVCSGAVNSKRRSICSIDKSSNWGQNQLDSNLDCPEMVKHSTPFNSTMSPCAVEGCFSEGFAGLLSGRPCLESDQDRRVYY